MTLRTCDGLTLTRGDIGGSHHTDRIYSDDVSLNFKTTEQTKQNYYGAYILSLGLQNYVGIVFLIQIIISIKFLVDKLMGRVATFCVRSLISLTVCGTDNLTDRQTMDRRTAD